MIRKPVNQLLLKAFYILFICLATYAADYPEGFSKEFVGIPFDEIEALMQIEGGLSRDNLDLIEIMEDTGEFRFLTDEVGRALFDELDIAWYVVKTGKDLRDDRIDPQFLTFDEVASKFGWIPDCLSGDHAADSDRHNRGRTGDLVSENLRQCHIDGTGTGYIVHWPSSGKGNHVH